MHSESTTPFLYNFIAYYYYYYYKNKLAGAQGQKEGKKKYILL